MTATRRQSRPHEEYQTAAGWRFWLICLVLLCLISALVGRLALLQWIDQDRGVAFLKHQGDMRAVRAAEIPAYRGVITDRRGEPLAVSTPVVTLTANPQLLKEASHIADLARVLGEDELSLRERLDAHADKQYMYLARQQTPDLARRVLAMMLPGVRGEREYRRYYPVGEVTAQLIGFTNRDGVGIEGLEKAWDERLRGRPGRKKYIKDRHGDAVRDIGVEAEAQPGSPLQLSIDLRLQYLQHRELQRAVVETQARAGAVVTLDAWTGEILAMTNHPVFNPNLRSGYTPAAARNRVVTDAFEPGSTVKPLTLVAALESGQYTIDTIIDTSPGRVRVGNKMLPDPSNYGPISLSQVIEKSSQVGVTKVAQSLGHEPVFQVFRRFGLGESSAIGFPGERSGELRQRAHWSEIEQVTLAFGYGLTATPLQLAHAYSVFANRGRQVPLTLLRRDPDAKPVQRRVVDEDIVAQVNTVLERVTGDDGTGSHARVSGFAVGGKTGTVHKVGPGGYQDHDYLAFFVGIAPIDNPRFVTVVVIDEPSGNSYGGGSAAAPVYSRITEGVLRLKNAVPNMLVSDDATVASAGAPS